MIARVLLAFETAGFLLASLVHSGLLVSGFEHPKARIAERVIAAVLLAGLASTWFWPVQARNVAFAAQLFAFLGTSIGLFTIAIGVGPRSGPDLAFHAVILVLLAGGLWATRISRGVAG